MQVSSIMPTLEAMQKMAQAPETGKVVMLNLLKFKPGTGAASYNEYGRHVAKILEKIGARVLFAGQVAQSVIGIDGDWDAIAIVEYPSRKVFLEMGMSAEYQAIHHFRDEGLERTELYGINPMPTPEGDAMGRNILFITTDQQRYDALGCNGGTIARTPVADRLAGDGINYRRAHNQNVVCMPARSTMITGQYVRTHGVVANGVALPPDSPSVAAHLHEKAGYHTALLGKAHFEPAFDLQGRWFENAMARKDSTGPYRGFDRMELAMHVPIGGWHYSMWMMKNHPDEIAGFAPLLSALPGGDTGAPEVKYNPVPREHYHTDWVAARTIAYLDSLDPDDNWFVWMSFPDPHHPWDPPQDEARRINWRDLDLPAGYPGSREKIEKILAGNPRHWLDWEERGL